jgi:uncharacterized protein with ATP-grasp and redox domains
MKNDINIDKIIEQAHKDRSEAVGKVFAQGTRKAIVWLTNRADNFLHAIKMSPAHPR